VLYAGSTLLLAQTSRHRRLLLASLPKSASNNLQKWFLSPTGRLNLGIITEGRFTIVLIIPSSWGFPTGPVKHQRHFLAPLPGRKMISARGVSHFRSFYFVIVFLSLFTLFLFASFYQKYKKIVPFIVGISLLLLLVHYVVP
jgi:hypothetical protein